MDGLGTAWDPVYGVGLPYGVVVGEGEPLQLVEDPRAKVEDEPLTGGSREVLAGERLQLAEERDEYRKRRHGQEQAHRSACDGGRHNDIEKVRQGPRPPDVVDGNLPRPRTEKRQWRREEARPENGPHGGPRPAGVRAQPSTERQIAIRGGRPPPPAS